jgi:uncharacterized RDD family membrane protein YckC
MTAPAGWYPDPSNPSQQRWWDGAAWTEYTNAAQQTLPPPSPNGTFLPPPPPVQYPAAAQTTGAFVSTQKASYGRRMVASVLDALVVVWPMLIALVVLIVGIANAPMDYDDNTVDLSSGWVVAIVVSLIACGVVSLGLTIWNTCIRQGRTGQSVGKKVMRLALVDANTGTTTGGWRAFGRQAIAAALGQVTFGVFQLIDVLWPLWDKRGQRVVDKMLGTVVVPCDDASRIPRK